MNDKKPFLKDLTNLSPGRLIRLVISLVVVGWIGWRIYNVFATASFGPDTWTRLIVSGLILGGMYALIAIGYTLVYGILFMINFAHGEVMMIGAFSGYFVFEAFKAWPMPTPDNPNLNFLNANPILSILIAFLAGMTMSALAGYFLEKNCLPPVARRTTACSAHQCNRRINLFTKCGAAPVWSSTSGLSEPGFPMARHRLDAAHWRHRGHDHLHRCIFLYPLCSPNDWPVYTGSTHPVRTIHAGCCSG